jgi:class 3 adenylate cyclase/predicted ATPase
MECPGCRHENAFEDKFCSECGAALSTQCASCQAELRLGAKFCARCGAAIGQLAAHAPSSTTNHALPSSTSARPIPEGERRQLTVLFCDMVGFTELTTRVDPEVLQEIIQRYEDACAACITRYEGYVYQRLGDGIVAFFGYPLAHEGEAERAVHAGLAIISALAELDVPEIGRLCVRIGIANGLVVVTSLERGAVGETMNLASRLQTVAQPGTIVVSESVRRLAGGAFDYDDLGEQTLKGLANSRAYRIKGVGRAESRFEAATQGRVVTMVAREEELAALLARWELAQTGKGQVVLLGGEPGIGKSRLLSVLREQLETTGVQSLRFQCSPYHIYSTFYPSITNFERALRITADEPAVSKLDKLEALIVEQLGRPVADVRFIAALLSLPTDRYGSLSMSPQRVKSETLRVLADLTEAAARRQPSVMLFEDAHWADPSSSEVLDLLVERIKDVPLLIVITHRPEFLSRWRDHDHVTSITLTKLTKPQSGALVTALTGDRTLPSNLFEEILTKTDGVPLFVEELTRSVLQSPELKIAGDRYEFVGTVSNLILPSSLRDSLMASLDRSIEVKEIAQIGAVLGRTFSYQLVQAIAPHGQTNVDNMLTELTASGLAFQYGTPPDARYTFKHALVQDAAYDSLLKARRLELHAQIAQVIEAKFSSLAETEPELLAHHYTAGGVAEPAIVYWLKAAKRAASRSAHQEAMAQLDAAVGLLDSLSVRDTRTRLALQVQLQRAGVLLVTKGMSSADTATAYDLAHESCNQLGDEIEESVAALYGIYLFHLVGGDALRSVNAAQDALRRAQRINKPALLVVAHRVMGASLVMRGDLPAAVGHLKQALDQYDPVRDRESAAAYGSDLKAVSQAWMGWAYMVLGKPDSALNLVHEAIRYAESLKNFHGVALMLSWLSLTHFLRREPVLAREAAQRGLDLAKQHEFAMWSNYTKADYGAALIEGNQVHDGIDMMQQYFAGAKITGHRFNRPLHLSVMAIASAKLCDWGAVARYLNEAIEQIEAVGERWFEAELHRLKGEFLLAQHGLSVADDATHYFLRSLDLARAQGARLWELRSSMSLAKLLQTQRHAKKAHEVLAPVYSQFTEGFETTDLKNAKELLDELRTERSMVS